MDIRKLPQDIALVDIDRTGETVMFARIWKNGYNVDDAGAPDSEEMFDGKLDSMSMICAALEAQGFSITMNGTSKARALRGPITRVDFVHQSDGWHIKKYCAGWTAKTRPVSDVVKTEEEVNAAISWCDEHKWSVRKWDGGARAFRGAPKPVRDANTIRAMRRRAEEELRRGVGVGTNKIFYDFAFDF
jgi:hypothetical protein